MSLARWRVGEDHGDGYSRDFQVVVISELRRFLAHWAHCMWAQDFC